MQGGPADLFNVNMACNWPLRGMKRTLFEGGVRATGFITGAGIRSNRVGTVFDSLIHATDWLPTLLTAAARYSGANSSWLDVVDSEAEPKWLEGDGG